MSTWKMTPLPDTCRPLKSMGPESDLPDLRVQPHRTHMPPRSRPVTMSKDWVRVHGPLMELTPLIWPSHGSSLCQQTNAINKRGERDILVNPAISIFLTISCFLSPCFDSPLSICNYSTQQSYEMLPHATIQEKIRWF